MEHVRKHIFNTKTDLILNQIKRYLVMSAINLQPTEAFISSKKDIPPVPELQDLEYHLYIYALLEDNQIEKSIKVLRSLSHTFSNDINNTVINLSGQFVANKRDKLEGMIEHEDYSRENNRLRRAFLSIVDQAQQDAALQKRFSTQPNSSAAVQVPGEKDLERVLGTTDHLVKIGWLQQGLKAAKSVCRVVLPNKKNGTGFVLEGGYLLTNFHVLFNEQSIKDAKIEFNYEEDVHGVTQQTATYKLDATDFKLSKLNEYDFVYVKILDPDNTLKEWGYLEVDTFSESQEGEPVNIIQHPEGGVKQIALTYNYVLGTWEHRLFYQTDTKKGSSGSPVFNKDWKVVALHHAGASKEDGGGLKINEKGDKMPANEGILMKHIMKKLNKI
jgi:V8-like Glu-specific endopeptidase